MDGYIYCLPQAGGRIRSQSNKNAPPTASHKGGGGGMGGWVGGGMGGWVGLQKLITVLGRFDTYKGGVRVGFININDMYNNDVGKGGVYAYEAYEVK